jgi:hypothetical protein
VCTGGRGAQTHPSKRKGVRYTQEEMNRVMHLAAGAFAMRHARRSRRTASARCVRASVNIPAPNGAATCILGFR